MTDPHDPAAPTANPEMGSARTMSAAEREAALAWRPDQCGEWTPTMFTDQLATTWCVRVPGHGIPHRDQNGCEWREVR